MTGASEARTQSEPPAQGGRKAQHVVSRQSGLALDFPGACNWGKKPRFGNDTVQNAHSPWGPGYFKNNALYKNFLEKGKMCTMGYGGRAVRTSGIPEVGPANYKCCTSAYKHRSSLDGKKYCTVSMKSRHEVVIGAPAPSEQLAKPGPGTYNVREDFGKYIPHLYKGKRIYLFRGAGCKLGMQTPEVPDKNDAGALYNVAPNLCKKVPCDADGVQTLKSTFGVADRFGKGKGGQVPNSSPDGELYYAHVKMEDPMKVSKKMGMGSGERTNWGKMSQHNASPASYDPNHSAAKTSSAFDARGLCMRMLSPVTQFAHIKSKGTRKKHA